MLHFHDGMTTAPECADGRVVPNRGLAEPGPVVLSLVSSGGGRIESCDLQVTSQLSLYGNLKRFVGASAGTTDQVR
jgi:hypothetical protein